MGSLSPPSLIVELSNRIAANTAKIDNYLKSHNLPKPSFDVHGPQESQIPPHETEIEAARVAIIDDTDELRRLILGPRDHLLRNTYNELSSHQAITHFRIVHSFPVGKEATFSEIAATTGLEESNVRQFIRHAIVYGIFIEPRPGIVAHNVTSRLLAEDEIMHDWLSHVTNETWMAAAHGVEALVKYPGSEEPNECAWSVANNTNKAMFEGFSQFPERERRFQNAMRGLQHGTGYQYRHVVDGYPWGELGAGTAVDVGGSHGLLSFAIAEKYPSLSFIVQDLEGPIEAAKTKVPSELADRIKFVAHDFFKEAQPVHGADVYFFRFIFHNWPDKYCLKILRSLIPALKTGAKVVIIDYVLPGPGEFRSRWEETRARSFDLVMTELFKARERELSEWVDLFRLADTRFEFKGASLPEGSDLSIIVAEWKGD